MSIKRPALFLAVVALVIPISVLSTSSGAGLARRASGQQSKEVSEARLSQHVQFLASDKLQGRRAGTASADESANYLARGFARAGLKPLYSKSFLQPFEFVAGVKLGEGNSFRVMEPSGDRPFTVGEDFLPLAFSSSDPAEGEIVFAHYGISAPDLQYDNYKDIDVKGKLVMIRRGGPDGDNPHGRFAEYTQPGLELQNKTLKAREKGARGILFVSEEMNFKDDSLSRLRHDRNFLEAGIPAVAISRQLASLLLKSGGGAEGDPFDAAKSAGSSFVLAKRVSFKTDVIKLNGTSANVVGGLRGSDPRLSEEVIVIGAHYDHLGLGGSESLAPNPDGQIHHGADDNASGTAALLELARVLSFERAKLKRSIVFVGFGAEEVGLLGSGAYVKNPPVPLRSTVAMLNMDMVGRLRKDGLHVGGVGTSPIWKPLLAKLNSGGESPATAVGNGATSRFQLSFGDDGFGPSDHQSFYVRDIPVLFFFTGSHDDYHKPSDTADKINIQGLREVAEFVRDVALAVAKEPERIAFTKVKSEPRPSGRGFRVYLGTVPNYSDQSDGMKLDGVRTGSPAERAGLQAGDVVVKLGKTQIKNVYDYTYALGELRAGEEIEAVIRRNGKELTVKLIPDKRP